MLQVFKTPTKSSGPPTSLGQLIPFLVCLFVIAAVGCVSQTLLARYKSNCLRSDCPLFVFQIHCKKGLCTFNDRRRRSRCKAEAVARCTDGICYSCKIQHHQETASCGQLSPCI